MLKQMLAALLAVLMVMQVACVSTPDPSDEEGVYSAISKLSNEERSALELAGKRQLYKETLSKKLAGKSYPLKLYCGTEGDKEREFSFSAYQIERAADLPFMPPGSLTALKNYFFRLSKQEVTDFTDPNNIVDYTKPCRWEVSNALNEAIAETKQGMKDMDEQNAADGDDSGVSKKTVGYLLTGAIAVAVLALIAPELLPALCFLGKNVYCSDTGQPVPTPGLPTNEPPIYDGDAP